MDPSRGAASLPRYLNGRLIGCDLDPHPHHSPINSTPRSFWTSGRVVSEFSIFRKLRGNLFGRFLVHIGLLTLVKNMADWKVPVSFNPSYHAFAYGLVYQPGAEQNHPNFSSWTEATYNSGVSASYYSQAQPQHQSPSWSPELNNAGTSNGQYPASVVCLGDPHSHTQSGRLFISNNRAPHDPQTETERPSSDTQSDSETHTSPGK